MFEYLACQYFYKRIAYNMFHNDTQLLGYRKTDDSELLKN